MDLSASPAPLPVRLGSGVSFHSDVSALEREVVLERLREHVGEVLRGAFPHTAFILRDRAELADEDDDAPELDVWLYCSWQDGPSTAAVRAVVDACTRVEVASPVPGLSFHSGSLVWVGYGSRGRSRAGWYALLAGASPATWERAVAWAETSGYRSYTELNALVEAAECEVWERDQGAPAPESRVAREEGLDLSSCGMRAWEVARVAAGLYPEEVLGCTGYDGLDTELEWFVLEGRALAEAALAECAEPARA